MNVIDKITRFPAVAHILAANERFSKRLGPQFAAAATYFSVLSLVPVLMFAVSMLGMTLTVFRPDLLETVKDAINSGLGKTDSAANIAKVVDQAFANWRSIGLVALLMAAYSGSSWVGNLKKAFRVMWRDKFSEASQSHNFLLELLENLLIFLGLLICIAVAFTITTGGSAFSEQLIGWFQLSDVPGISILLRLASIGLALLANWLLFAFIFVVMPGRGTDTRSWIIGTIAGAVLLALLQQLAGVLVGVFKNNAAASIFGSVIVLMLVMNLLATLILMIGAWVGTAKTWQAELATRDAEKAAGLKPDKDAVHPDDNPEDESQPVQSEPETPKSWADRRLRERWAARQPLNDLRAENFDPASTTAPALEQPVSAQTARRGMKLGMGLGYGLGAATGVGIGAAVVALLSRIFRR